MTATGETLGWREGRLLDVARPDAPIGYGIVQPGPYVRGGPSVIAIRDLPTPSVQTAHRCSREIEAAYRRSRVCGGDVLISVKGTTGRIGLVPDDFVGNISRDVARIRLRDDHSPAFWFQMLQSLHAQRTLQQAAVGSTRQELSIGVLKTLRFRFPSRQDQERIAAVLADADHLIGALDRMVAKKQAIKQGMMQQLLTGHTRLPGFDGPWEHRRLGDLLAYEQPGPYLVSSADYGEVGTPVLTAGKTFVLGRTTETQGICDVLPVIIFDDFTTASKFVSFPFKAKSSAMKILCARPGVNLRYVYERMQLIDYPVVDHKRRWIAEYSRIGIEIPQPQEQDAISSVVSDAEREIAALRARVAKAQDVKQGMMQELLTGRTRLPVEESAA